MLNEFALTKMSSLSDSEIKIYGRRWFVVALLVWLMFLQLFSFANFGFINNVTAAYFQTTYSAVDWMVLGCNIGSIAASPIVAWLALKQMISCRRAMITCGVLQGILMLLIVVGFIRPDLFGSVVFGQVLGGIAMAIVWTVPSALAQLWFPETQIGLATGFSVVGTSTGAITSYLLLSHTIFSPKINNSSSKITEETANISNLQWLEYDQFVYEQTFSTLLGTVVCVLLALLFLVPEQPDKPPSQAQRLKRNQQRNENISAEDYFTEVKKLMTDSTFIVYAICSGVMFHISVLLDLTVDSIIDYLLHTNAVFSNSQENFSAYVLCCYNTGCCAGNFVAGFLLDWCKQYSLQSSFGALLSFLVSIALLLSVYFGSAVTFFILSFLHGMNMRISYISLIDSLMQHTYPTNPVFVFSILTGIQNLSAVAFIECGRQITYNFGLFAGLGFMSAMIFPVIILSVIFKPNTKRLVAEHSKEINEISQLTPLLSQEL